MLFVGEVIHRASVPEVHMVDHADLFERIERAVHRGDIDGREAPVDVRREFVGGDVSVRLQDGLDDDLTRGRATTSCRG